MMKLLLIAVLLSTMGSAFSAPVWLPQRPQVAPLGVERAPAPPPQTRVMKIKDTVTITDTVIVTDTLEVEIEPIEPPPKKYRYKLQLCELSETEAIKLDFPLSGFSAADFAVNFFENLQQRDYSRLCQSSVTVSDSVYSFRYGGEKRISDGWIFDNQGNKFEVLEKKKLGVDLRVKGDEVQFDHTESKDLSLRASLDSLGQLYLSTDYERKKSKCTLWVLCRLETEKVYLFLRLLREDL